MYEIQYIYFYLLNFKKCFIMNNVSVKQHKANKLFKNIIINQINIIINK